MTGIIGAQEASMQKVPFATPCPVCRAEVGSHDKASWAVPAWPASLPVVRAGRPVNHNKPEQWPVRPVVCGHCGTEISGDAIILQRLILGDPDPDDRVSYRAVRYFGGVRVRAE